MIIYHEARRKDVASILTDGLNRNNKGARSQDQLINKTNAFLDACRPQKSIQADVWRTKSVYGFVGDKDWIIELSSGRQTSLQTHLKNTDQALFRLTPAMHFCYVSDLDLYDRIKTMLQTAPGTHKTIQAAEQYWHAIVPFHAFTISTIKRPEIMVTCNIPPAEISLVAS